MTRPIEDRPLQYTKIDTKRLASLVTAGNSDEEIAQIMDRPKGSIRRARKRLKMTEVRPARGSRVDVVELTRLVKAGKTDREVSQIMKRSHDTVQKVRRRLGLPVNPDPARRGGGSLRGPYPPEVWAGVSELVRLRVDTKTICNKYECTEAFVYRVRKKLGMTKPHPSSLLPPLEERLAMAARMVEEHASFTDISRTAHISRPTLHKLFPGQQWTAEEAGRHAMAIRYAEKRINEVWESGKKTRLTKPPMQT